MKDKYSLVLFVLVVVAGALIVITLQAYEDQTAVLDREEYSLGASASFPLTNTWCVNRKRNISYPLYSDGYVFILEGINSDEVTAFDGESGKVIWSVNLVNNGGVDGTLGYWTIASPYMVLGSSSAVYTIDIHTGQLKWEYHPWNNGFAVGDGKVFTGNPETIRALDLETGNLLWEIEGQGRGSVAPLFDPVNDVVVLNDRTYRLLDPLTGNVIYEIAHLPETSDYSYNWNGGQIYHGMLLRNDEAFIVMTGDVIHPRTIAGSQSLNPFIDSDYMLIGDFADVVKVDLVDFHEMWRYRVPLQSNDYQAEVLGDPVALNDMVYTILSDSSVRAIDLKSGQEIGFWRWSNVEDRRFGSTPLVPGLAVGAGRLFATFGTNSLCAFEEK